VAARLSRLDVSKLCQRANEIIARNVARQSHTAISSSRTE
jgi:hypothetical protein